MRTAVLVVLGLVPSALVGWVAWRGARPPAAEPLPAMAAAVSPDAGVDDLLRAALTPPPAGLELDGAIAFFGGEDLFDHINGAAPLYLERGFRRLAAADLRLAGGPTVTCDLFDMGTPANAERMFAAEASAALPPVPGWKAARSGPLSFAFADGRVYVKLTAFDEPGEALLPGLARALAERLP